MKAASSRATNRFSPASNRYRPEIDGLRAFAVIAVIINHVNRDLLPSGYLGVDIFFVISGYVITASLSARQSNGFLDFLSGFYQRRINRLWPALVVFVLITSVLICLFNPDPGVSLGLGWRSLFGVANLNLYSSATDYFAQSTELNPFTHTWSLGVEEQFYLLFPALIWFSGFGKKKAQGARVLCFWLAVLSMVSLIGFVVLYRINQPAAYFLMPSRFWELAAGSLVFIGCQKRAQIENACQQMPPLALLGAMVAVMFLPVQAAVPATLAIVILSAILIVCLQQGTAAYRLLTLKESVYTGLISYSLYLWHWTVLCISRWTIGIHWWTLPFQVGLMLLMAAGSYKWVEKPCRTLALPKRGYTFLLGTLALLATTAISRWLADGQHLYWGNKPEIETDLRKVEARTMPDQACQGFEDSLRFQRCPPAKLTTKRIAMIGDSFSTHMLPAFNKLAQDYQVEIIYKKVTWGVWYPFPPPPQLGVMKNGVADRAMSEAIDSTRRAIAQLVGELQPGDSILFSTYLPTYFSEKYANTDFHYSDAQGRPISRTQALKEWSQALETLAEQANNRGIRVMVIAPLPQFMSMTPNGVFCYRQWYNLESPCKHGVPRQELRDNTSAIYDQLAKLRRRASNLSVLDPFDAFCSTSACYPFRDRQIYFIDSSHLSVAGALHLYQDRFRDFVATGQSLKRRQT